MSDITTVEEVDAEGYTVRVAQTDDGSAWEAVVLSEGGSDSSGSPPMFGPAMLLGRHGSSSDDDSDDAAPIGPPVTAPHRWVAIGFAIEAYEWDGVGEEAVSVPDGYDLVEIEGMDLSLENEDSSLQPVFGNNDMGTFSASFTLDPEDTDE